MTEYFICPHHNVLKTRELKRSRNPHCHCGAEMILYHDTMEEVEMCTSKVERVKTVESAYQDLLENLHDHDRIVGGSGSIIDRISDMKFKDVFNHFYMNDIVIWFRNERMKKLYQYPGERVKYYEDRED